MAAAQHSPDAAAASAMDGGSDASASAQQQQQLQLQQQQSSSSSSSHHHPPPPPPPPHQASSVAAPRGFRFGTADAMLLQCGLSDGTPEELQRLEQLLESNAFLGAHMHQLVASRLSSGAAQRAHHLLQTLQAASSDPDATLRCLHDLHQLLLMGNEDSLAGFPAKAAVPLLAQCLHSPCVQTCFLACQCLNCLLDRLPRSASCVLDALPALLDKSQPLEVIDVAETALSAVELLSRRHGRAVLQAGGVSACLRHIDFFTADMQARSLAVVANCFQHVRPDDFHLVADCLAPLAERLRLPDQRIAERVAACFCRLLESCQTDRGLLMRVAGQGAMLDNLQQLLLAGSPAAFHTALRALRTASAACPDLAVRLLRDGLVDTLRFLLASPSVAAAAASASASAAAAAASSSVGRASSSSDTLEVVRLVCELLPPLPGHASGPGAADGGFSVCPAGPAAQWMWQDDKGSWRPYSADVNQVIEQAYQTGDQPEVPINAAGRAYLLDLTRGEQVNEETGNTRPVQRRLLDSPAASPSGGGSGGPTGRDARSELLIEGGELAGRLVETLLPALLDAFADSSSQTVRLACLQAILRLLCHCEPAILRPAVNPHSLAGCLAGMLAAQDLRVVAGAVQLAGLLLARLPDLLVVSFRRQGVVHALERIAGGAHPLFQQQLPASSSAASSASSSMSASAAQSPSSSDPVAAVATAVTSAPATPEPSATAAAPTARLTDFLRRRKTAAAAAAASSAPTSIASQLEAVEAAGSGGRVTRSGRSDASGSTRAKPGRLAARAHSLFSHLAPWAQHQPHRQTPPPPPPPPPPSSRSASADAQALAAARAGDRVRAWAREQATRLCRVHFAAQLPSDPVAPVAKLGALAQRLPESLPEVASLLAHADLSAFELLHCGLLPALHACLCPPPSACQDLPLRAFLSAFLRFSDTCPLRPPAPAAAAASGPLSRLVSQLLACLHQTETFSVRVTDSRGGGSLLSQLGSHQLRCLLVRHPAAPPPQDPHSEPSGPVKVDPLALVHTVERYLAERLGDASDGESSGTDADEMADQAAAAAAGASASDAAAASGAARRRRRLQLLIGEAVLQPSMTVLQAVRLHSAGCSADDTDPLSDLSSVWARTHTIYYRPMPPVFASSSAASSSAASAASATATDHRGHRRRRVTADGSAAKSVCGPAASPLRHYQDQQYLSAIAGLADPCRSVLSLLSLLYGLNTHYPALYNDVYCEAESLLPPAEFCSPKLTAKVARQLQDPLAVLTGQVPAWVGQLSSACPFLLGFEARHLLLYVLHFDRDRALLRLQELSGDGAAGGGGGNQEGGAASADASGRGGRVAPKVEKRRRVVSRRDLLRSAERVLEEMGGSRALLEISYEGEVGTGLGPTLEFYSLVSREFCRADLGMWRSGHEQDSGHLCPPCGLYPRPMARGSPGLQRLKSRFRTLGRLMAKSVLDSRKLDLALSPVFYQWLLGQEACLGYRQLVLVDPDLARSWRQLAQLVIRRRQILEDASHTPASRELALGALSLDGCPVEELGLDFTLPGYPELELARGGRETVVTLDRLEEYLDLVAHWTLVEGVRRQMEAFLEGFESVLPAANLRIFRPDELELVFCGASPGSDAWDVGTLAEACRPDHGFTLESRAIRLLFQLMAGFDLAQRRSFLQFVTGSPRLPVGGWRSLNPPLTVVVKRVEGDDTADKYLPSATTCVNYLKLPDYSSVEVMRLKLLQAMDEGQLAFHLS